MTGQPLWRPDPAAAESSHLAEFTTRAQAAAGTEFPDYASLHRWSVADPGAFWAAFWDYADIVAETPFETPVRNLEQLPGATWFPGARLNFAANLLRYRDDQVALVSVLETGARRQLTYRELHDQTAQVAAHLAELGVKPGDRVAGWLPNVPEAVVAMLATASPGAVWSSCSPDFGASGALDRFGQIEPRVLFACDGYHYNGKRLSTVAKVQEVVAQVGSIEQVIWVTLIDEVPDDGETFASLLQRPQVPLAFTSQAFDSPLYVLYSSGTTGKPKCIVHGVGGTLLQHMKEHQLHVDLHRQDRLFFFTTCGWMMWNWLVSALATGCTLVLYDGSPFHPGPETLWSLAEDEGVTVFGTSAKYLSALEKAGYAPGNRRDLTRMRTLLSTGSPLCSLTDSTICSQTVASSTTPSITLCTCRVSTRTLTAYQPSCCSCWIVGEEKPGVTRVAASICSAGQL